MGDDHADCVICGQVNDPDRLVVVDSEHFVSYVSDLYPWAVIAAVRRHACEGPWEMTNAESRDLATLIPGITSAIRTAEDSWVYMLNFGDNIPTPHYHVGFFSGWPAIGQAVNQVLAARTQAAGAERHDIAARFAAGVRDHLGPLAADGTTDLVDDELIVRPDA